MTSIPCQSKETCLARVTVQKFQTVNAFDQNCLSSDSLDAGFQASMYTISKHKLYVAVSLLSVVVKFAQKDLYSRLPLTR